MKNDEEKLNSIFDKTDGYCAYCERQLAWGNYGAVGARGAWEVDHSMPLSRGGTDHLNNLFPACADCNRLKADMTGREFRAILEANAPERGMTFGDFVVAALAAGGIVYLLRQLGRQGQGPGPGAG